MCEVSTLLNALKIDGRPLACEHAVLIRQSETEGPGAWGISVLGPRAGELARLDGARRFSALRNFVRAGVVGTAMIFQGVQAVALPLVQEFGYTGEIEDRIMAPLPVWAVAVEKIAAGAVQAPIAALVVFPLAAVIPASPVHLHVHWLYLLTIAPIGAVLSASLGLTLGTRIKPQQVPLLFAIVVLPITFLGAVYYPWASLAPIRWLQVIVLINPLIYMCEGFRLALTSGVNHMPVWAIYVGMSGFTVALAWVGVDGLRRRVLS